MLDKIKESWESFKQQIAEQEWYKELKSKWDDLDPQIKFISKSIFVIFSIAGFVLISFGSLWSVYKTRYDLNEKKEILSVLQNATQELRQLQKNTRGTPSETGVNWNDYLKGLAPNAQVPAESVEFTSEKEGKSSPFAKEALIELRLNKVNIKHVIKYIFQVENGPQPIKVRNVIIETIGTEGHLNAHMALSGFSLSTQQ